MHLTIGISFAGQRGVDVDVDVDVTQRPLVALRTALEAAVLESSLPPEDPFAAAPGTGLRSYHPGLDLRS